ncbi:uncharacterized protein [Temnothorax longispinosus]|uniref:uncharacterized protein n=1 Tax=Temnothorax longispinosus TaxID=300112 RepID=UPI003A9A37EF
MDVVEGEAKMCRLCGHYEKIYIDVFGEEGVRRYLGTKIHEKINILIHKDDPLPQQICGSCVDKLDSVCDFYDSCHVIQERLWWLIESSKNQHQEIQKQPADYQTNKGDDPTQEGVTLGTEYSKEYSNIIIKEECLPDLNLELYPSNQETQEQPASYQTNKGDDPMQEGVTLSTEYSTEHLNIIIKEECLPDLNLELYSSNNSVTHKCPKCPKVYKTKWYLNEHLLKHEGIKKTHKCPKCPKVYTSTQNLNEHLLKHEGIKKTHKCPKCSKVYTSKQNLNEHLLKHEGIKKTHKCPKCSKVYTSKQNLNEHLLKHEGIKKTHKCPKCPKVYKTKWYLNEHLLKHEGIKKTHKCPKCPKVYTSKQNLNEHLLKHEGIKKTYKCPKCPSVYTRKQKLNEHLLSKHEGIKKTHKCPKCPQVYTSKQNLNYHLLKHEGIRKYECSICKKRFGRQSLLARHQKVHPMPSIRTRERP